MTITKSGELASFYTVNKAPIKHLKVYFSPKQSGSGDPSPENVRPIEGYNNIEIYHIDKKNLFDKNNASIINSRFSNGIIDNNSGYDRSLIVYIPCKPNTTYNIIKKKTSRGGVAYVETINPPKLGDPVLGRVNMGEISTTTINTSNNAKWLCVYLCNMNYDSVNQIEMINSLQIEEGEQISISWEANIGTIYGGYIDLITGELVETWGNVDLGTISTWYVQTYENAKWFRATLPNEVWQNTWRPNVTSSLNNHPPHFLIDRFKIVSGSSIYYGTSGDNVLGMDWLATIRIKCDSYNDDIDVFKAAMNGVILYYEYTTPITHQLTPQQLQTLLGQNNIWSNADRVEIEYDLAESNDELYRRRNILLRTPHIETVAGSIASFKTDMQAPLKECKIYFEPVQEGEGDPSPDNVRAIRGWNEIELKHSNINLYDDIIMESGYYKWYIPEALIGSDLIYSMEVDNTNGTNEACIRMIVKDKSGTTIKRVSRTSGVAIGDKSRDAMTLTDLIPSNASYIYFGTSGKNTIITNPMIEIHTRSVWELSQYEPYTGTTIPITFPSEAGTIYGGYIDLISGELISDWIIQDLNSLTWVERYVGETKKTVSASLLGRYGYTTDCPIIAEQYPTFGPVGGIGSLQNPDTQDNGLRWYYNTYQMNPDTVYLVLGINETPQGKAVSRLSTPIRYQLPSTQLKTLRGTNNIWSNANGNMQLSYWKH